MRALCLAVLRLRQHHLREDHWHVGNGHGPHQLQAFIAHQVRKLAALLNDEASAAVLAAYPFMGNDWQAVLVNHHCDIRSASDCRGTRYRLRAVQASRSRLQQRGASRCDRNSGAPVVPAGAPSVGGAPSLRGRYRLQSGGGEACFNYQRMGGRKPGSTICGTAMTTPLQYRPNRNQRRGSHGLRPTLHLTLLVFAFVLFVLAGIGVGDPRFNFGWLGLAFLTLALWIV